MTALLIPQAISKETTVCKVEAAGMTFHCKLANDLTLKEGKSYTFTLTLNKSEISAINSVISDWKTSHIRGNITPDYPEIID